MMYTTTLETYEQFAGESARAEQLARSITQEGAGNFL